MQKYSNASCVRYKSLGLLGYSKYRVGTDGSVWSRVSGVWKRRCFGKSKGGYRTILFQKWRNKLLLAKRVFLIHRLVLLAFVGPCPEGMEACHNNGDPSDNRLENLRWDTHKENMRDRDSEQFSKLTRNTVAQMRKDYATGRYTMQQLADREGVHLGTVYPALRGVTWKQVPMCGLNNRTRARAKLTNDDYSRICKLYATSKWTKADLGRKFGVTKARICQIVRVNLPPVANEAVQG